MAAATLEVCIDDLAGLAACQAAGADRVELCAALALGGLTPSVGLMRAAAAQNLPVYALIRPRSGDFRYSASEIEIMAADIAAARDCGLSGVVLGAATADRRLDVTVLERLSAAAAGMGRTLHRVVDTLADPLAAVDVAVDLGFERILSAGGAATAAAGAATLAAMQRRAAGRIEIMAGAGITARQAPALLAATGIRSLHASCRHRQAAPAALVRMGLSEADSRHTSADAIGELKRVLVECGVG